MRSYCVCFTYFATLILLQFCQSEAHVHKHHIRYAQAHHHSHLKNHLLRIRQTDLTGNGTIVNEKTEESDPKSSTSLNNEIGIKTSEDATPNAPTGLNKEVGKCQFPSDAGLTAVTPHAKNAGWAMAPDEQCSPGSYCPYACPPGKVMAQWNPNAKAYTYPQSMDGGLYCDHDGQVKKPFPEKPYCVPGTGGVGAHNKIGKGVSFCQTVLPGSESMLIPTHVEDSTELAVPGTNYWCKTAAHYYINPPGVGVEEACVWGNASKPVGNWSPYVAGANTDESGRTFVKVGWNPIFTGSALSSTPPQFGVKITCDGGGCNGTPCSIDPAVGGVGKVQSANTATGAGGADFCVVTVPKGSKANIEVFSSGPSHITSEENSPKPSKSESSSSSTSVAEIATPAPTESKDLEEKPEKSPDTNLLSGSSGPRIENSSITSLSPTKEEKPKLFSDIPVSKDEHEVQVNLKPDASPSQGVTYDTTPEVTYDAKLEATEESGPILTNSEPDHLFDESPSVIPHTNNVINHPAPNHPSPRPALFETETKLTSIESAGIEHTAAITSNTIHESAQQASMASVNKIYSYSNLIQIGLLISVFNLLY
ncbi:putative secreted beta-glucosidase adg3 [Erysiphe neolycopersici]|uniref:Putative secreted beta-glucosidase adg3 n=1 Tax=Erysiphe neolycopersici TaxID=212602 RepID=A0A420HS59_9PEZI|nr:putative secreted beta-glucosidase adg3 [Erysiphe neolycopersici]